MLLKQSTARNLSVLMTDSSDHISGKTGLTLTIYASKDGGTPAAITPTVTELDSTNMPGWYKLALTTSHTDTLGDLALHVTATGADPSDLVRHVVAALPGELTSSERDSVADALLKRDWSSVTGEAARSVLNALRLLRNKFSVSGSTLTVTKEDDTTSAWTAALTTDGSATPIVGVDPA